MCPPIMAVGIGITDALRSQVYLAPLCVQRQMELESCPWALQWVFPKVTFQTQLQLVGLKAWTCGREHERQVFQGPQLAVGICAQFQLPGDVSPKATPKLGF